LNVLDYLPMDMLADALRGRGATVNMPPAEGLT
jgi:hypothetical protein